jgi:hypothetical protein
MNGEVKQKMTETNGACVPESSYVGRRTGRHVVTLMWTCPEGYTRGPSWVGRVLRRLTLQKGRQSSGVVIPNKKGSDNNTWQQEVSP